jgi:hypothetical protein
VSEDTAIVPGALPLRSAGEERYCRARARLYKMREAAELAGFSPTSGHCSKLEKKPRIIDRIAYLTRVDEEILRAKREEVEAFYWFALRADPAQFWADGKLKAFEDMDPAYRQLIEGLTYTEKGKPNLKIVSKQAVAEALRKLNGYDMPAKFAPTTPEGKGLTLEGLIAMSYAAKGAPAEAA